MKNLYHFSILILTGMVFCMPNAHASEAPKATETCAKCHNENGISDDAEIATIAGASSFFLENQLAIFAEEARPCVAKHFQEESDITEDDHCELAGNLGDAKITELAAYYASLPVTAPQQEVDEALADRGKSIHTASCDRCHTDGGSLALDDAGILAVQWKQYLLEQFQHYQQGERWQPEKMQPEMDKLSAEDMQALAEFYAREGLQRFE